MFLRSPLIMRYVVGFAVFMTIALIQHFYLEFRDANARLDQPIVERHGLFVLEQYDTFGRTNVTLPDGGSKKLTLDPARPMAEQVQRSFGLWDLGVTRTTTIAALEKRGSLRRSTQEELDAWFVQKNRKDAFESEGARLRQSGKRPFYTMLRPIGDNVFLTDRKARLLMHEKFDLSDAPQGAEAYYRMREGDCWGKEGIYCSMRAPTARPACFGPLPREFDLHLLGTMAGVKDSPVRVGGSDTKQVDLYIAPTPRPVVLALGAMRPTTWAFHLEPGANIAAVLVAGNKRQAISGLPPGAQLRFTHKNMTPNECGNGLASHMYSDIDPWSRDLRAIFGKEVDAYQAERTVLNFEIGGDFNLPQPQSDGFFGAYDNKGVVPLLEIDHDSLRHSVPAPMESGLIAGLKDWLWTILNPKTLPYIIGFILAIRPAINLVRRLSGKSTYGPKLPPTPVFWAYFRGVGVTVTGIWLGLIVADQHPMLQQSGAPMILILLLALAMAPVVKAVFSAARAANVEIGLACIGTGAAVAAMAAFGLGYVKGSDPSLLLAPFFGALGGLEFWRSRRFPGATERGTMIATALSFLGSESASATLSTAHAGAGKRAPRKKAPTPRKSASAPAEQVFSRGRQRHRAPAEGFGKRPQTPDS